jgi:hypothetical protein
MDKRDEKKNRGGNVQERKRYDFVLEGGDGKVLGQTSRKFGSLPDRIAEFSSAHAKSHQSFEERFAKVTEGFLGDSSFL